MPEFLILIFEKEKEKERREKKKEEEKKDLLIDTLFCFMDVIIIICSQSKCMHLKISYE